MVIKLRAAHNNCLCIGFGAARGETAFRTARRIDGPAVTAVGSIGSARRAIAVWPMSGPRRAQQLADHLSAYPSVGRTYSAATITRPGVTVTKHELSPGTSVATITISNSQKLNIVNSEILSQLTSSCNELSSDPSLRAVVLTGGATAPGKPSSFIGGADIKEMHQLASPDEAREFITRIHLANKSLRDLPVPVLARVHGFCLGAGLEIATACDLRIATKDSVFGMPEVKVGIPSVVEAALLPGLIGMGRTRRLLYLAENIDAVEAERWGLVEKVVEDELALDKAVDEWVARVVEMGPKAIRSQKLLMQKWENCTVDEGIQAGVDAFAQAYADGGKEPQTLMGQFVNRSR